MNKKQAIAILESILPKPYSDEVDAALCYLGMLEMPSKRFRPPTIEEVAEYCESRRNGISAESFVNHYQANGWIRGRTPMKDWQAAVRLWEQKKPIEPQQPKIQRAASHINVKELSQQPQLKLVSTEGKAEAAKAATSAMRDKLFKG